MPAQRAKSPSRCVSQKRLFFVFVSVWVSVLVFLSFFSFFLQECPEEKRHRTRAVSISKTAKFDDIYTRDDVDG